MRNAAIPLSWKSGLILGWETCLPPRRGEEEAILDGNAHLLALAILRILKTTIAIVHCVPFEEPKTLHTLLRLIADLFITCLTIR